MFLRISTSVLLLLCVLYLPFWAYVSLIFAGMIYFSFFFEGVMLFLLSDLLFGATEAKFFDIIFVSFFVSAALMLALEILKKKLKFYV